MNDYFLHQSKFIEENVEDIKIDLDIAHRLIKEIFPDKDSTWAYGFYNIFAITAPSTNFYKIYKELSQVVRSHLGTDQPLWLEAWLNYHSHDELLQWHSHEYDYHGYISIDPKQTKTIFEGYEITNKPGQIYFGPGQRFHKVEQIIPFDGIRTTIGFDIHTIPNNNLVSRYVERPFKNLGLIPLL